VGSLRFVDAAHGFFFTGLEGLLGAGELYRTRDGGATWAKGSIPLGSRGVSFLTASNGFSPGGQQLERLYETTDGGSSWRELRLPPPPGLARAGVAYGLPTFVDVRVGVLPTTIVPRNGAPTVAFYQTRDSGKSWSLAAVRAFPEEEGALGGGVVMPTAVVDAKTWLVADPSGRGLSSTSDGGRSWRTAVPHGLGDGAETLDFASPSRGWSLVGHGDCEGTDKASANCVYVHEGRSSGDGGQTWEPIR
jgi:photosystem II stability/assembly factor-like uncharacterized protein